MGRASDASAHASASGRRRLALAIFEVALEPATAAASATVVAAVAAVAVVAAVVVHTDAEWRRPLVGGGGAIGRPPERLLPERVWVGWRARRLLRVLRVRSPEAPASCFQG